MSKQRLDGALHQMKNGAKDISKPPANYPSPTPEDLKSQEFKAVWDVIKSWDINVPDWYDGYTHAEGNHVMAIINALKKVK